MGQQLLEWEVQHPERQKRLSECGPVYNPALWQRMYADLPDDLIPTCKVERRCASLRAISSSRMARCVRALSRMAASSGSPSHHSLR